MCDKLFCKWQFTSNRMWQYTEWFPLSTWTQADVDCQDCYQVVIHLVKFYKGFVKSIAFWLRGQLIVDMCPCMHFCCIHREEYIGAWWEWFLGRRTKQQAFWCSQRLHFMNLYECIGVAQNSKWKIPIFLSIHELQWISHTPGG